MININIIEYKKYERLDINVQLVSQSQYKSISDKNVNLVEWKA